jgi:hypothetical protein
MLATEQCANIKFCVLLYKSLSEALRMIEEAYDKPAMNKALVCE